MNKSKEGHSRIDELYQMVTTAAQKVPSVEILAKDFVLVAIGIRVSVLIDYMPFTNTTTEELISIIGKLESMREEFAPLRLAKLCEGNYLVIHLSNLKNRMDASIKGELSDFLFVDCSATLKCPAVLNRHATCSLILPFFVAIYNTLLTSVSRRQGGGGMRDGSQAGGSGSRELVDLGGEDSGAPLPTLAGWLLEYPVVYYTAGGAGQPLCCTLVAGE